MIVFFFFFKQKTAYEMRISDWSSDVCSSDLTDDIWDAAAKETQEGYDCNTGADACSQPVKGKMKLVEPTEADRELLKKIAEETVVPKWAARCSDECDKDFNATIGKKLGITVSK